MLFRKTKNDSSRCLHSSCQHHHRNRLLIRLHRICLNRKSNFCGKPPIADYCKVKTMRFSWQSQKKYRIYSEKSDVYGKSLFVLWAKEPIRQLIWINMTTITITCFCGTMTPKKLPEHTAWDWAKKYFLNSESMDFICMNYSVLNLNFIR